MYARVVQASADPARLDEVAELWRNFVAPSARAQAGFRGARLFINRESGAVLSMGLWESRAAFDATIDWNRGQVERFAAVLKDAPHISSYDLAAEALPDTSIDW
jgi:quinol monooxygenase YgiN